MSKETKKMNTVVHDKTLKIKAQLHKIIWEPPRNIKGKQASRELRILFKAGEIDRKKIYDEKAKKSIWHYRLKN